MGLESIASNHPIKTVIGLSVGWLVLLSIVMVVSSVGLGLPVGHPTSISLAHLTVTICIVCLMWKLNWLKASGLGRLGGWPVWLISLAGLAYFMGCSLYAFYGMAGFDSSTIVLSAASREAAVRLFLGALSEEIVFRGLVLFLLARAWSNTKLGLGRSVLVTSAIFSLLHLMQAFTPSVNLTSVLYLLMETLVISFWWGALVLWGRSIWPAVILHYAVNVIVAIEGLSIPMIEPSTVVYSRLFWFSVPLGLAGMWLLLRVIPRSAGPQVCQTILIDLLPEGYVGASRL